MSTYRGGWQAPGRSDGRGYEHRDSRDRDDMDRRMRSDSPRRRQPEHSRVSPLRRPSGDQGRRPHPADRDPTTPRRDDRHQDSIPTAPESRRVSASDSVPSRNQTEQDLSSFLESINKSTSLRIQRDQAQKIYNARVKELELKRPQLRDYPDIVVLQEHQVEAAKAKLKSLEQLIAANQAEFLVSEKFPSLMAAYLSSLGRKEDLSGRKRETIDPPAATSPLLNQKDTITSVIGEDAIKQMIKAEMQAGYGKKLQQLESLLEATRQELQDSKAQIKKLDSLVRANEEDARKSQDAHSSTLESQSKRIDSLAKDQRSLQSSVKNAAQISSDSIPDSSRTNPRLETWEDSTQAKFDKRLAGLEVKCATHEGILAKIDPDEFEYAAAQVANVLPTLENNDKNRTEELRKLSSRLDETNTRCESAFEKVEEAKQKADRYSIALNHVSLECGNLVNKVQVKLQDQVADIRKRVEALEIAPAPAAHDAQSAASANNASLEKIDELLSPLRSQLAELSSRSDAQSAANNASLEKVDELLSPLRSRLEELSERSEAPANNISLEMMDELLSPLQNRLEELSSRIASVEDQANLSARFQSLSQQIFGTADQQNQPSLLSRLASIEQFIQVNLLRTANKDQLQAIITKFDGELGKVQATVKEEQARRDSLNMQFEVLDSRYNNLTSKDLASGIFEHIKAHVAQLTAPTRVEYLENRLQRLEDQINKMSQGVYGPVGKKRKLDGADSPDGGNRGPDNRMPRT